MKLKAGRGQRSESGDLDFVSLDSHLVALDR